MIFLSNRDTLATVGGGLFHLQNCKAEMTFSIILHNYFSSFLFYKEFFYFLIKQIGRVEFHEKCYWLHLSSKCHDANNNKVKNVHKFIHNNADDICQWFSMFISPPSIAAIFLFGIKSSPLVCVCYYSCYYCTTMRQCRLRGEW
jgi:hypothetical protein